MGGSVGAAGGGVLGQIMKQMAPNNNLAPPAPPAVPPDGNMQPTVGPGTPPPGGIPPVRPLPYQPGLGLPKGGLLGIANGTAQPQGIAGLLQHLMGPQPGQPSAPAAGPLAGPPSADAGMIGPPAPGGPMNILPDVQIQNQF